MGIEARAVRLEIRRIEQKPRRIKIQISGLKRRHEPLKFKHDLILYISSAQRPRSICTRSDFVVIYTNGVENFRLVLG